MTGPDEWVDALRSLDLPPGAPVIAHASLSAFGPVDGGAGAVVSALLSVFDALIMPTFTYTTMVTPETGPPDNGLTYGAQPFPNFRARFFEPDLHSDALMGILPETLRLHASAGRSRHPILSFAGVNAASILETQTIAEPLAPIAALLERRGWGLLLGVDHTVNSSIHYGERLAGRQGFTRWALTPSGVVECPHFPGCSDGFDVLTPRLAHVTRRAVIGRGQIQAFPLSEVMRAVERCLAQDPLALLCNRPYCERCEAVRDRRRWL